VPVVPSVAADAFTAACTELGALGALVVAAREPSTVRAPAVAASATAAVPGAPAFVPAVLVVPAAAVPDEPSAAAPAAHTADPPAAHAVAAEDPCVAAPASAAYSRCDLRGALSLSEWGLLGGVSGVVSGVGSGKWSGSGVGSGVEVTPSPPQSVRSGSALRTSLSSEDLRSLGLGTTSGHAGSAELTLHNSGSAALTSEELSRLLEVGTTPTHAGHSGGEALGNALLSNERSLRSFPVGTDSGASPHHHAGHALSAAADSASDLTSEELSRLLEVGTTPTHVSGGAALCEEFSSPLFGTTSGASPHHPGHAGRAALRNALSPAEMCSMEVGIADAVGALERSACRGAPRTPRGLRFSLL
jgi:hypothetical protein